MCEVLVDRENHSNGPWQHGPNRSHLCLSASNSQSDLDFALRLWSQWCNWHAVRREIAHLLCGFE